MLLQNDSSVQRHPRLICAASRENLSNAINLADFTCRIPYSLILQLITYLKNKFFLLFTYIMSHFTANC